LAFAEADLWFDAMNLTLPDEPALASFNEAELRLELAVALFSSGRVSRTVAASIAGQDQFAFDEELFHRRIPSFTHEMLEEDLSNLPSRRTA
jgi:predicted HTH domain antitoxin